MPHIIVKIPEGVFDADARKALAGGITAAAKDIERIGDDPAHQTLTLVAFEEMRTGQVFVGGQDALALAIPVLVFFYPPAGVIEEGRRAEAVRRVHEAIAAAKPVGDPRRLATSVIIADVADGTWGASGVLWRLPDFARAAGYKHLQHLVQAPEKAG